jgi:hypothetical protein
MRSSLLRQAASQAAFAAAMVFEDSRWSSKIETPSTRRVFTERGATGFYQVGFGKARQVGSEDPAANLPPIAGGFPDLRAFGATQARDRPSESRLGAAAEESPAEEGALAVIEFRRISSPELGRGFGLQKQKPLAKSF